MKNVIIAAALLAATATPAMARDFTGPRFEVTAGADNVTKGVDPTDVTYGAALGYDVQIGKMVVGVEATAANVFDKADLGAAARLGFKTNDNVLVYGRAGYSNLDRPATCVGTRCTANPNLEGLTVGGGIEAQIAGPVYAKAEYRYTDFSKSAVGRHGALVGVGVRF
jgi:outer membrane immunogenic protein